MTEKLLLIVDDNPEVSEGLAAVLESDTLRVVICADRESAESIIDRNRVDVLLTDIRIAPPFGYGGLDLLSYFKQRNPRGIALAMTGHLSDELAVETMRRGAMAILEKPFDIEDVHAFVLPRSA